MPVRKLPLVNDQIYHIYNRGITLQPVFIDTRDYKRGINILKYYSVLKPSLRYSQFILLSESDQILVLEENESRQKLVDIICYCLMPNHFHLLLIQNIDKGIEEFARRFEISYTRYFNIKRDRNGPLFQGRFKNVLIDSDSQLLHVSRYIHLNPYASHIVNNDEDLINYRWSSFGEYITGIRKVTSSTNIILRMFKNIYRYRDFVVDHADYQRKLNDIKHLTFD